MELATLPLEAGSKHLFAPLCQLPHPYSAGMDRHETATATCLRDAAGMGEANPKPRVHPRHYRGRRACTLLSAQHYMARVPVGFKGSGPDSPAPCTC